MVGFLSETTQSHFNYSSFTSIWSSLTIFVINTTRNCLFLRDENEANTPIQKQELCTLFVPPLKLKQAEIAYISSDLQAAAVLHLMQNTLFFLLIHWGKVKSSLMAKTNNECWYWCDTSLSNTGAPLHSAATPTEYRYCAWLRIHLQSTLTLVNKLFIPPSLLNTYPLPTHTHLHLAHLHICTGSYW